ncbi:MAG: family 10 glycosylhydrolase [Chloroflexota bacterium]|nr:family 10 glycosylhydrolase [Chloroflexota bacterium]
MSQNIMSVSWTDHLLQGKGDGQLKTVEALKRRMQTWQGELGIDTIYWRQLLTKREGIFSSAPGSDQSDALKTKCSVDWDDFAIVPELAHELGMSVYLYVSVFDDGRPLPPKEERETSYHNRGHGQHLTWQSSFTINHPEYLVVNRKGDKKQWGVLSLSYPEVRNHLCERFQELLVGYDFDGLFICLRSQSKPPDFADEFGYNEPIRDEYCKRYGKDILVENFDNNLWYDLQGEYLSTFINQLKNALNQSDHKLGVGCARGDVIGHPIGNTRLQWRDWVDNGLLDHLVINQYSDKCPSMWFDLWPMHRGTGYTQNYINSLNMPTLEDQLTQEYGPTIQNTSANLYVARQWDKRSITAETNLLALPAVNGLVYSSFRYDNSVHIKNHGGDWNV